MSIIMRSPEASAEQGSTEARGAARKPRRHGAALRPTPAQTRAGPSAPFVGLPVLTRRAFLLHRR